MNVTISGAWVRPSIFILQATHFGCIDDQKNIAKERRKAKE
jgi:hypothetical protein